MHRRIFWGMVLVTGLVIGSMGWGISQQDQPISPVSKTERTVHDNELKPDFALQDLMGKTVRLSDFVGQVCIVDFWATWCLPCRQEIPHFQALYEKYHNQGVAVIGISMDQKGPEVVRKFAKKMKMTYPTVMGDKKTAQAFGDVRSIPTTFVIDQDGNIVKKYVGYQDRYIFERDILALLKEPKI